MRKQRYFISILLLLCASVYLGGCNPAAKVDTQSSGTEAADISEAPAPVTPQSISETYETTATVQSDTVADEVANELDKDIDNNGIMDSVQLLERTDGTVYANVTFNGEDIFQYEWKELRLMSVDSFEYIDLDQDNENEIFITVYPMVNSMPLIETMTLKLSDGQWNMMDIPLNELGNNCFPITITRGEEEFDFVISSGYTDMQVHFDAASYYVDDNNSANSIRLYRNEHFVKGDTVGYTSSWGIWEAQAGSYNGRNCIIAQHGINGSQGKFNPLGTVDVYYAYDENGSIEILDLVHME